MFFLVVASLGFISRVKKHYGIFCHFDGVSDKHLKIKGFLTKVILVVKWFFTASAKNDKDKSILVRLYCCFYLISLSKTTSQFWKMLELFTVT